jgi:hypothetical protein
MSRSISRALGRLVFYESRGNESWPELAIRKWVAIILINQSVHPELVRSLRFDFYDCLNGVDSFAELMAKRMRSPTGIHIKPFPRRRKPLDTEPLAPDPEQPIWGHLFLAGGESARVGFTGFEDMRKKYGELETRDASTL